jgi:hypothetical protein
MEPRCLLLVAPSSRRFRAPHDVVVVEVETKQARTTFCQLFAVALRRCVCG